MSEAPLAALPQARPGARGTLGRAAWIALALVAGCVSGAPEPIAPEPAAEKATAAARVYQVFFDWNSASLTDEASTTLAGVAGRFDAGRSYQIEIIGHADPREDVPNLNRRRAQAVRARLIRLGIAAERITVASADATDLADPLPGLPEPQHRRAEIGRR